MTNKNPFIPLELNYWFNQVRMPAKTQKSINHFWLF